MIIYVVKLLLNWYGFRSKIWSNFIEKYGESRTASLEISKAFDQMWLDGLVS